MFPPWVTSPIYLEVYCCNKIYECAVNTFQVTVYDTDPVKSSAFVDSYIIQFDSSELIGQHFSWAATWTVFYDLDQISDSSNDPYNH